MAFTASRWRAPVTGSVAGLAVAAAIVGPSALASGGGSAKPPTAGNAAHKVAHVSDATAAKAKRAGGQSAGPGPGPFLAAVAQLEQAGTINAAQARVLDADIRSGSMDTNQLVANGTLSSAQMQAVNNRLIAVKRSLAPAGSAPSACTGAGTAAPKG